MCESNNWVRACTCASRCEIRRSASSITASIGESASGSSDRRPQGGGACSRALPRVGILPSLSIGLGRDDDEFDGRVLVIQWGRFVFEIFIGRRA